MAWSKGWWKGLLFYVLLFVGLLVFLEVVARCVLAFLPIQARFPNGDYVSDILWRKEWAQRHRGARGEAALGFDYARHDPILGWRLKPGLKDLPAFKNKVISSNSKGIRGKREFPYERVPGKRRIVLLGDSFTFGTEVSDSETYAWYLQELMPDVEVINMGVFGYGFDQMLLYLRQEGVKYRPDIVMLGYLPIDSGRSLLSFRDFAKPQFVFKKGELVLRHVPVPSPDQVLSREPWRLRFLDLLALAKRMIDVKAGDYYKDEDKVNRVLLTELVRAARAIGAVPVFAYLDGVRSEYKPFEIGEKEREFFRYWQSNGVPCIFLYPYRVKSDQEFLKQLGKDRLIMKREYGHFSPRENRIVAEGIYDFLKNLRFVK